MKTHVTLSGIEAQRPVYPSTPLWMTAQKWKQENKTKRTKTHVTVSGIEAQRPVYPSTPLWMAAQKWKQENKTKCTKTHVTLSGIETQRPVYPSTPLWMTAQKWKQENKTKCIKAHVTLSGRSATHCLSSDSQDDSSRILAMSYFYMPYFPLFFQLYPQALTLRAII